MRWYQPAVSGHPVLISPSVPSWRDAYITLGCSLILLIVTYWATATSTVALWSQDPLAHGYLVIPVALYLAWDRREQLKSLRPKPAFWALPFLGLVAFMWLLGNLTVTSVVQQVSLVAMLVGFVWGVLGTPAVRALLFPLGFLAFALPLGDQLVPALQEFTATFAVKMLDLSGVPVLLQGHVISIPGSTWLVAEACGGINYLMSSLAIGYLYSGTAYRSWIHRVGFLLASAVVPLAANGIRVYTTILIASLGGTRIAAGMEHYLYGWLVFTIIMGLLFATCGRWREEQPEKPAKPQRPVVSAAPKWSPVLVAILGLLLVGIAPASARSFRLPLDAEGSVEPQPPSVSLPWRVADRDRLAWTPHFVTPSAEFLRSYDSGNHQVKVYLASYGANRPDAKLASGTNVLFEDPWRAVRSERRAITHAGRSFQVREIFLEAPASSLVVWSWYRVDGTFTSNDYVTKLLLAKARLFRSRQVSAAIAVATENRPDVDAATILQDFLGHLSVTESFGAPPGSHTE